MIKDGLPHFSGNRVRGVQILLVQFLSPLHHNRLLLNVHEVRSLITRCPSVSVTLILAF